jgi:hypothetical protein
MAVILDKLPMILGVALLVSECAAAVVQLLFPDNKGFSGFLAGLIKVLQGLKGSPPPAA